ncbi:Methyl-CpG-binding domain-containing protein 4 [Acorus calamus]|uniref:Methyl-CpG-binding domain-containing protein 4 n=1 Tax=Acorus calamus TaxID=4465 RepID=A0AAV9CWT0_ACOCL|nr:Methyl-CpG-binding domain-containing protein 4 [Acorus calamus]
MKKKSRDSSKPGDLYAAQCEKCFKWRLIPSKEEYETVRQSLNEDPWYCDKKPGISCDDPGDIDYDTSHVWVIDKPNIPKTPPDCERMVVMRKDFTKMDTFYIMPNGKRVRSRPEVEKFLEAYPKYKDKISVADFNFTVPRIPQEMVPKNLEESRSASGGEKKMKVSKADED